MPNVGVVPMVKLWVLPFDCPEFADSDGWIEKWFESESAAFDWCCNHAGLIEIAELGIDRAVIVSDGQIDYNALGY